MRKLQIDEVDIKIESDLDFIIISRGKQKIRLHNSEIYSLIEELEEEMEDIQHL